MTNRAPVIVPISELRRDTSRLIRQMERTHLPLFVTQRGYVSAVMLSREEYDMMCVLRDKGMRAIGSPLLIAGQEQAPETEGRLPSVREVTDDPEYWDDW